jgi:hypothetical protein
MPFDPIPGYAFLDGIATGARGDVFAVRLEHITKQTCP